MIKAFAIAALVAAAICFSSFAHFLAGQVDASHTHLTDPKWGEDYVWPELEAAGSNEITYLSCGSQPSANWVVAVEDRWEAFLPDWDFSAGTDCNTVHTVMRWEDESFVCLDEDWSACWEVADVLTSNHQHVHLERTRILFDEDKYGPHSYAWKTAASAHEWGHNLDLADDLQASQAAAGSLMNHIIEDPPTYEGPTSRDLTSVACAYGRCTCNFNGVSPEDLAVGVPWEEISGETQAGALNGIYGSGGGLDAAGDQLLDNGREGRIIKASGGGE